MRPRLRAAENTVTEYLQLILPIASMRPRLRAAENISRRKALTAGCPGFNEAAAESRGKRVEAVAGVAGVRGFNEAAAESRGKPIILWEL